MKCGALSLFTRATGYSRLVRQLCHTCFKEVKQAERPAPSGWGQHRRAFGCGGGYRIIADDHFMR